MQVWLICPWCDKPFNVDRHRQDYRECCSPKCTQLKAGLKRELEEVHPAPCLCGRMTIEPENEHGIRLCLICKAELGFRRKAAVRE